LALASSAAGQYRALRVAATDAAACELRTRSRTGAGLRRFLADAPKIAGRFPGSAVANPPELHFEFVAELPHGPHPTLE